MSRADVVRPRKQARDARSVLAASDLVLLSRFTPRRAMEPRVHRSTWVPLPAA
ncbi:hypothetical protein [Microbacterium halophytorum]|uniref:hypothetical protein n=1 Tax=Microbacterium halophytorum TaxID=2067568 RepID=UPI001319E424|nr:hypothetical protein [Microbacterium halophytorum]